MVHGVQTWPFDGATLPNHLAWTLPESTLVLKLGEDWAYTAIVRPRANRDSQTYATPADAIPFLSSGHSARCPVNTTITISLAATITSSILAATALATAAIAIAVSAA